MEISSTGGMCWICAQCGEIGYTNEPHVCSVVECPVIEPTSYGPVFNNNELVIIQKLERIIELLEKGVYGS